MGVGYDGHAAGFYDHLTHILVDDCFVRRYKDSAGFLAGGLRILMYIRIDGTTNCTQAVMAVGKYTWHRELF